MQSSTATHLKKQPGQEGISSSSSSRKVAQSSVYLLWFRLNPHFAQGRQDTPIHQSSKVTHKEGKVCSRGKTIKVLPLTLTLFTNHVLKHPYCSKTTLKLLSKCCVCLSARLHGGDQCIYTIRIGRTFMQCYHMQSCLGTNVFNLLILSTTPKLFFSFTQLSCSL